MDEVLGLVGGGKGETGEIPASGPARMGFSVGEGVGSGVVACMLTVGGEGAGLCAFNTLKPVLLFPCTFTGDPRELTRGFEGRTKTFFGCAKDAVSSFSSSGVGGS